MGDPYTELSSDKTEPNTRVAPIQRTQRSGWMYSWQADVLAILSPMLLLLMNIVTGSPLLLRGLFLISLFLTILGRLLIRLGY
jgi:hypothetical protein